jgi:hypothetical protein
MRFIFAAVALLVVSFAALAVGPQDVTLTFTKRAGGGPVDGYRLYVNDVNKGAIASGMSFAAAVPGNGTYKFCVRAHNATAEAPDGNCQTRTLSDLAPALTDVVTVTFQCAATPTSLTCSVVTPP